MGCENHAESLQDKDSQKVDWISNAGSTDVDSLVDELLFAFLRTCELEGICNRCLSLVDAGNDVGAAEPVRLGQIGR